MFLTSQRQRQWESIQCFIAFLITPAYYLYQLFVIRPYIISYLQMGSITQCFHIFLATYFFINVAGNMFFTVLTDCRVKNYHGPGNYCEHCKQNRPAGSWHCTTCNACILGRDHHCTFLAHCVGRKNIRYFTCYFCHLALSMIYATYYNYLVIRSVFDLRSFSETTSKLLDPWDWIILLKTPLEERKKRLCVFFWFLNLVMLPFSTNFALFHLYKAFRGLTWYEYRKGKVRAKGQWKSNLAYFFGTKWYMAMLWPFVNSPLPDKRIRKKKDLRPKVQG